MVKFTLSILVIICAIMLSFAVIDRRWFIAVIYLAVAVFLYNRLERDVFRD